MVVQTKALPRWKKQTCFIFLEPDQHSTDGWVRIIIPAKRVWRQRCGFPRCSHVAGSGCFMWRAVCCMLNTDDGWGYLADFFGHRKGIFSSLSLVA